MCVKTTNKQSIARANSGIWHFVDWIETASARELDPPPSKMTSVRTKLLGLCDVLLRVPPLFIIDEILKIGSSITGSSSSGSSLPAELANYTTDSITTTTEAAEQLFNASSSSNLSSVFAGTSADESLLTDDLNYYKIISVATLKFIVCSLGNVKCYEMDEIYAKDFMTTPPRRRSFSNPKFDAKFANSRILFWWFS